MISGRTIDGLTMDFGHGPQPMTVPEMPRGVTILGRYGSMAQDYVTRATRVMPRAQLSRLWGATILHAILAANTLKFPTINTEETDREMKEYAHYIVRWGVNGCPNFQISHSLEASLLLTDCAKVRASEIRFPFPAFAVSLPSPHSAFVLEHPDGRTEAARWIMFHTMRAPTDACRVEACAKFDDARRAGGFNTIDGAISFMEELEATYEWMEYTVIRVITESGLNVFRRAPWPVGDATLETWVGGQDEVFHGPGLYEMNAADLRCTEAAYRLVANLALYLSERLRDNPSLLRPRTPKRERRDGDIGNPITTFTVGNEVKLSREVREAARAMLERGQTAAGWTLKSRHVVRGHWKQQAKGPGRVDRERIWVQPYWRGEDLGEAVARVYAVEKPREVK